MGKNTSKALGNSGADLTMTSREIAQLTGKQHKNVLADCGRLNENHRKTGLAEIPADVYRDTCAGAQLN